MKAILFVLYLLVVLRLNSFICLAVYSQYDSDDSAHEGQNGQRLDSSIEKWLGQNWINTFNKLDLFKVYAVETW